MSDRCTGKKIGNRFEIGTRDWSAHRPQNQLVIRRTNARDVSRDNMPVRTFDHQKKYVYTILSVSITSNNISSDNDNNNNNNNTNKV